MNKSVELDPWRCLVVTVVVPRLNLMTRRILLVDLVLWRCWPTVVVPTRMDPFRPDLFAKMKTRSLRGSADRSVDMRMLLQEILSC